jgi:SAM-dependent methyltransferase
MSQDHATSSLGIDQATLLRWPGKERREPRRSDRHYLVLAPLVEQIRTAIDSELPDVAGLRVLDIGCGVKPYLPLLADRAGSYRGLDTRDGPFVDDVGFAEHLPYQDESFDLVLCTQVLEHAEDPPSVVSEISRVLSPGGVALASTHGVFLYHPDPPDSDRDYWRWTHSGLERLFGEHGKWSSIEISPNGNFVSCIGYLLVQFVDEAGDRSGFDVVRRALTTTINAGAEMLDRRYPSRARVPRPGSLSPNYLVICRKA